MSKHRFKCKTCGYEYDLSDDDLAAMPFKVSEWECGRCGNATMEAN